MSDPTEFESLSDPAIEARIVAMVLGEASAFERAELDRLVAERPELGIFARRIKAVHDLATTTLPAAHNLPDEQWKLSPARRAKIEAVIGSVANTEAATPKVVPFWKVRPSLLRIAAALTLICGIGSFFVLNSGFVQKKAYSIRAMSEAAARDAAAESEKGDAGLDLLNSPTVRTRSGQAEVVEVIREFDYSQSAAEPAQALAAAEAEARQQAPAELAMQMAAAEPVIQERAPAELANHQMAAAPQSEFKRSRALADNEGANGPVGSPTGSGSSRAYGGRAQAAEQSPEEAAPPEEAAQMMAEAAQLPAEMASDAGESAKLDRMEEAPDTAGKDNLAVASELADEAGALMPEQAQLQQSYSEVTQNNTKELGFGWLPGADTSQSTDRDSVARGDLGDTTATDTAGENPAQLLQQLEAVQAPSRPSAPAPAASPRSRTIASERRESSQVSKNLAEAIPEETDADVSITPNEVTSFEGFINYGSPIDLGIAAPDAKPQEALRESSDALLSLDASGAGADGAGGGGAAAGPPITRPESSTVAMNEQAENGKFKAKEAVKNDRAVAGKKLEGQKPPEPINTASAGTFWDRSGAVPEDARRSMLIPLEEFLTTTAPVSTFSLHVGDVSFQLASDALLRENRLPDPERIRTEEFVNAFDFGDPAPSDGEPVALAQDQSAHPFLPSRNLVRLSVRTASAGRGASQPLHLTVLLDKSGSMERPDRADATIGALKALASLLTPSDSVSLVTFDRAPRLVADRLSGPDAKAKLTELTDSMGESGTNLEEAMKLALEVAERQFDPAAQNRVVLVTDGVVNLGNAVPEALAAKVQELRAKRIAFDVVGVATKGIADAILETMARNGDGRYVLMTDDPAAAESFASELAGAFRPAARNVKVQVRFNPERVKAYSLLGFKKHRLKEEDFRNDQVDAAEMAAAEEGSALYQTEIDPQGSGEIGQVFVRFQNAATGEMVERNWIIPYDLATPPLDQAPAANQLATSAALLAEKLQSTPIGQSVDLAVLLDAVREARQSYPQDARVLALQQMLEKTKNLTSE